MHVPRRASWFIVVIDHVERPPRLESVVGRSSSFGISTVVHALGALLLLKSAALPALSLARGDSREAMQRSVPVELFVAPLPEPGAMLGLQAVSDVDADAPSPIGRRSSSLSLPKLTLDLKKISGRAGMLFPIVTPGLALEQFLAARPSAEPHGLPNPLAGTSRSSGRLPPPLLLDSEGRQSIVDRSWSRHERWNAFQEIAATVDRHSANTGDLPALVQLYFEQNGLQPFADPGALDPPLWAQLAIAADHADFIGFISRYSSTHPASRTTTALLLVLDTLIQSNIEDMVTFLAIDPPKDLELTRRTNADAYRFIVDTQSYYRRVLARKHLDSLDALKAHYDAVRLGLLDSIARDTPDGYRVGDVRYLMGCIYWRQGNVQAAIETWNTILVDPGDSYFSAYATILEAIQSPGSTVTSQRVAIDRVLAREHSRWRSLSYDRLTRFGYRFDTF